MGITKITKTELLELTSTTGAVRLPSGTTAERPSTNLNAGDFRFNTDDNKVEYYDGSSWFQIDDESLPPIPSENFNTLLYSGNGGTQSITGAAFQPDLVWVKRRSAAEDNVLFDSVRGVQEQLRSNNSGVQSTKTNALSSFDSSGFTTGANNALNTSGETYVGWCFKGGGAPTATNSAGAGNVPTAGSVKIDGADSTTALAGTNPLLKLSANTKAGFSVATYAGTGANSTIAHGLSSAPKLVIIKNLNGFGQSWAVYSPAGATQIIYLNQTAGASTNASYWQDTAPTDTITTLGNAAEVSWSGQNFVAYSFADVAGYQKIGTYTGNGSSNGPIVETGFEIAFLMIKRTDGTSSWTLLDNKRSPANPRDRALFAEVSDAEITYGGVDFFTNGFQITATQNNVNGGTYLYWAIAADADATTPTLANSFKTNLYTGNGSFLTVGGHLNGASQFNGSSSRIQLPSGAPFGDNNTIKCISGWFALSGDTNTNDHPCRLYSVSSAASPVPWFAVTVWGASYNYVAVFRRQSTGNEATAKGYYTPGTLFPGWHHVAVQLGSTEIEIYLDGRKLPTIDSLTGNATNTSWINYGNYSGTVVSQIGKSRENTPKYFKGSIDQVRFFDAALTSSQILELYNETTASANTLDFPTGAGCIAAYPLDTNSNDVGGNYNGTDSNITYSDGPGFQPSFAWIKGRGAGPSGCGNPVLFDSVRGLVAPSYLASSLTNGEFGNPDRGVISLHKDGYTVGDDANGGGNVNGASGGLYTDGTYVGWSWKGAVNLPTINTDGSITSIVSANPASGFSAVKYTGNGGSSQSVGHGLNSAPEYVIFKRYDTSVNWFVFVLEGGTYVRFEGLNTQNPSTSVSYFGATSNTITWSGTTADFNGNGNSYLMYCFHSVSNYCKVGSYTGTGGSGNAQDIGFQPGFIIFKNSDGTNSWWMFDSERGDNNRLFANSSNAESTSSSLTTNSTGFSFNDGNSNLNALNDVYVYLAIKQ